MSASRSPETGQPATAKNGRDLVPLAPESRSNQVAGITMVHQPGEGRCCASDDLVGPDVIAEESHRLSRSIILNVVWLVDR